MSSNCNKCGSSIIWPKEFKPGNRPLNPDSTIHECMKTGPKPVESKPAEVKTPNTVLEECIVFSETFKDIDPVRFDALARIYISGRMRR